MRSRRSVLVAAAAALVTLAWAAAALVVPFFTQERDLAAVTPQPTPLDAIALLEVPKHKAACSDQVTLDPSSQEARVRVGTFSRPGMPLRLVLTGPGYRQASSLPGTAYKDNDTVRFAIRPPAEPVFVSACLHNDGASRIALYGSSDRTRSRSRTTIGGKATGTNYDLAFYERRQASISERLGTMLKRVSAFRPIGRGLLWPLLPLTLVLVPLGATWAILRAVREDEDAEARAELAARRRS